MGIQPIISQCAFCSLTRRKIDTSTTPVQQLQFSDSEVFFSFYKCDTVKAVHFARDMLPICQVICKRLGSVSTLLLPTATSNGLYHYCYEGQSCQYLNPTLCLTINSLSEQTRNPLLRRAVMSR